MSVIVKAPDGKFLLMCKGADSIIAKFLKKCESNKIALKRITSDLRDYAKTGLRTLLLAQREVSEIELQNWETAYLEAQMSQSKDKDEILDKLIEDMEKGLFLVGATAIEDKLQVGVGDSIAFIREAGVKVWVLTGDKVETAVNIGYSCKLLDNKMHKLFIESSVKEEILSLVKSLAAKKAHKN